MKKHDGVTPDAQQASRTYYGHLSSHGFHSSNHNQATDVSVPRMCHAFSLTWATSALERPSGRVIKPSGIASRISRCCPLVACALTSELHPPRTTLRRLNPSKRRPMEMVRTGAVLENQTWMHPSSQKVLRWMGKTMLVGSQITRESVPQRM